MLSQEVLAEHLKHPIWGGGGGGEGDVTFSTCNVILIWIHKLIHLHSGSTGRPAQSMARSLAHSVLYQSRVVTTNVLYSP